MNINQMRQFATVAKYSSMTRAAQELYVTQQALSKSIKLLQNEMGGELFVNRGQGLQLTDLGSKLLAIVDSLLPRYDSCMKMVSLLIEQNKNRINISYEHGFMQYAVPAELMIGSTISIHIADDAFACQEEVAEGRADLGICSPQETMDERLEYIPLVREPVMFLVRQQHPLASKGKLDMDDLRGWPQIMPSVRSAGISRYINGCIDEGFYPNFVMESRDFGLMLRALLNDDLMLPCPSYAVEKTMSDLVLLPLEREGLYTETGVILRRDNRTPRIWEFIGEMQRCYGGAETAEESIEGQRN